jgi:toxin ParE1/3/4
MSTRILKSPQSRADLIELAGSIARDNLAAAERFLAAAEDAFALLSRNPDMGTACNFLNPRAAGIRMWTIRGFENRVVFYRPIADGIDVVRVIHASRDFSEIFVRM